MASYRLKLKNKVQRIGVRIAALRYQWLRQSWPSSNHAEKPAVAILIVNFNTLHHLAHLLFSLYQVVGREQFASIVVVDNGSADGSVELLQAMQRAGLLDPVFNHRQRYHGPALNQGIDHLADMSRQQPASAPHRIWILDSDTIVLRPDAIAHPLVVLDQTQAGLLGQYQFDELAAGYAHPSSLLLDPAKVWKRGLCPFEESGAPAVGLHNALRRRNIPIVNFPYRSDNYILHLGRATLRTVQHDTANRYQSWAKDHWECHYHGNSHGAALFENFCRIFDEHVPNPIADLAAACTRRILPESAMLANAASGVPDGADHSTPAI